MKLDFDLLQRTQLECRAELQAILGEIDAVPGFQRVASEELDDEIRSLYARRGESATGNARWWVARRMGTTLIYESRSNLAFVAATGLLEDCASEAWRPLENDSPGGAASQRALQTLRDYVHRWNSYVLTPPLLAGRKVSAVSINFAAKCNLRCDYCFNDQGRYGNAAPTNLIGENIERVLEFLLTSPSLADDVQVICFGGEPLLAARSIARLVSCYRKASLPKRTLKFAINTNGTLLKGDAVALLDEHFDSVGLSLDLDGERHNFDRPFLNGAGSYSIITRNLRGLPQSLRSRISLEVVLTSPNVDLERYEASVQELGVRYADFGPVQGLRFALGWRVGDTARYVANLERFYARRIGRFAKAGLRLISGPVDALGLRFGRPILRKCGAGRQVVSIGSDGKVGGCWAFQGSEDLHLGDIFDPEAPLSSEISHKFDKILNPAQDSVCSGCVAANTCGGHCTAMRKSDDSFRARCGYLKQIVPLHIALRYSMSREDQLYVRQLHYDH